MKIRNFLLVAISGLLGMTSIGTAQRAPGTFSIGILGPVGIGDPSAAFVEALRKLGYEEGRNLTIVYRSAKEQRRACWASDPVGKAQARCARGAQHATRACTQKGDGVDPDSYSRRRRSDRDRARRKPRASCRQRHRNRERGRRMAGQAVADGHRGGCRVSAVFCICGTRRTSRP
jgi:hypothetical protein